MYSLFNFNPFLPIGWPISKIFTKLFRKAVSGCLPLFIRGLLNPKKLKKPTGRGELNSVVFKKVWQM
jgi:hypothetical protein